MDKANMQKTPSPKNKLVKSRRFRKKSPILD